MPETRYHAKTYEPYTGPRAAGISRAPIITARELAGMWRIKWVKRFLLLSLSPTFVLGILVYVNEFLKTQGAPADVIGGHYYNNLFEAQTFFMILAMAIVGAGLITKDTKSGAYQLYFSRPLTRRDYLLGKLGAAVAAVAMVTLLPTILLSLVQLLLVPDLRIGEFMLTIARGVAYSAIVAFSSGVIILLMSAYGKRARNVGLVWLALCILSEIVRATLQGNVTDNPAIQLISIRWLFAESGRVALGFEDALLTAPIVLLSVTGIALVLLWSRLEALERREP